jgi:hypothetical protein
MASLRVEKIGTVEEAVVCVMLHRIMVGRRGGASRLYEPQGAEANIVAEVGKIELQKLLLPLCCCEAEASTIGILGRHVKAKVLEWVAMEVARYL